MSKGLLIIYAGPSGVGKGTIVRNMLSKNDNLKLSVSVTTRQKREGETEGVDYYYITREKFSEMVNNDELLEHTEYCGNCYGTPKKAVMDMLDKGIDVLLEIEVDGFRQIKEKFPDAVSIFVLPPSQQELFDRLNKRGTETDEQKQLRIKQAEFELSQARWFDYRIINDDVNRASNEILSLIQDIKD